MGTSLPRDLGGHWVGTMAGTNQGGISLELVQSGNQIAGTASMNEPQIGTYEYVVKGAISPLLPDGTINFLMTLDPSESRGIALGVVRAEGKVLSDRQLEGRWRSKIGTKGIFSLRRELSTALKSPSEIFVVHGHDEAAKMKVARCLERLGLKPILLSEQPDQGRTIIEKFEQHAGTAGFAVILFTADDTGGSARPGAKVSPRARQNVILEMGYFIGKLGRSKVCTLYSPGVELPSDLFGVVYTPLDAHGGWEARLGRELRAAGYEVDMNKLF
ncbi:MAG: nucleotide-binding protein containing -like protein domain-like protein [Verrucomicrobia bacterium]|nr:nucleotide-binding protein containing -like protein domain-like protein [Verrucomicrobiota bacterium]